MDPNAAQGAEIAPRKLVISLVALCLILLIREQRGSCIFDKHNECDKSHHVSTRGDWANHGKCIKNWSCLYRYDCGNFKKREQKMAEHKDYYYHH